jgi:hypothetical protein
MDPDRQPHTHTPSTRQDLMARAGYNILPHVSSTPVLGRKVMRVRTDNVVKGY